MAKATRTLSGQKRDTFRRLVQVWWRDVAGLCFTPLVTGLACWPSTFDGMTAIVG